MKHTAAEPTQFFEKFKWGRDEVCGKATREPGSKQKWIASTRSIFSNAEKQPLHRQALNWTLKPSKAAHGWCPGIKRISNHSFLANYFRILRQKSLDQSHARPSCFDATQVYCTHHYTKWIRQAWMENLQKWMRLCFWPNIFIYFLRRSVLNLELCKKSAM